MNRREINEFLFVALRDNLGATGGPGGVLYVQQTVLGDSLCGKKCAYRFNFIKTSGKKCAALFRILNLIAFFFYFLFKRKTYYIVHDVETGCILSILKKRYSQIYHHQGSLLKERIDLGGENMSKSKMKYYQYMEQHALLGSESLHFPSNGAAEMYFSSDFATCTKDEVILGQPLYNIILTTEVSQPKDFPLKKEDTTLTFFSLGTLTMAKGQDQTVEFLSKFIKNYNKPIKYIMVGNGPLRDSLIKRLNDLQEAFENFDYLYFERVDHNTVMYIHSISDIYIMLHRISIFDFATLEAMSQKSAIILSKVGGNPEYDKDNNIIFGEDVIEDIGKLSNCDFEQLKEKNKKVFDEYFSPAAYKKQYEQFILDILRRS